MTKTDRTLETRTNNNDRREVRELSAEEIAQVSGGGLLSSPLGIFGGGGGIGGVGGIGGLTNPGTVTNP